jgi:hypothetical protein
LDPIHQLYQLLDATGVMCWDENRDYGAKYMDGAYAVAMRDMVKAHRNHPSIVVWSFCNEYECEQEDAPYSGKMFRAAANGVDPSRLVTANGPADPDSLDVQGFSHSGNSTFEDFHKKNPNKPSVLSECCSCTSQRDSRSLPTCIASQNSPGLLPYVSGSLGVWTLFDYFGEPKGSSSGWPHVSCSFGQFDIAGFPKPHAYWYEANWLQGYSASNAGRPALPSATMARILNLSSKEGEEEVAAVLSPGLATLISGLGGGQAISAITNAPFAEVVVDGKSLGIKPTARDEFGSVVPTSWSLNTVERAGEDEKARLSTEETEEAWMPSAPVSASASAASNCTGPSSFPHNASGVQCKQLQSKGRAKRATDPTSCAQACCADATCNTWQWDMSAQTKKGCWVGWEVVGSCKANPKTKSVWAGGQRDGIAPGPSPPGPAPPGPSSFAAATLNAMDGSGTGAKSLASHTLYNGKGLTSNYELQLTLDVPSIATGTGSALLLDGRDTALVRVSVLEKVAGANTTTDADGYALVTSAAYRVSWRVVSGPGRLVGIGSGDDTSHEWLKSSSVQTYLGLARGMFAVTLDCVSAARDIALATDVDNSGAGGTKIVPPGSTCDSSPIVIEATAEGLAPVNIAIPTSQDAAKDSPLAVARAAAKTPTPFTYLDTFIG